MNTFASFGAFNALSGKGEELLTILMEAARQMSSFPGCKEYRVYRDAESEEKIWVSEIWTDEEAHKKCLQDPVVRELISKGIPLISDMPHQFKLIPVEG